MLQEVFDLDLYDNYLRSNFNQFGIKKGVGCSQAGYTKILLIFLLMC